MKKINTLAILSLLIFSACSQAEKLVDDTKQSYQNVAEEAEKAVEKVNEVKDKTIETVNDIQDAAKEINEASDAVKKITK